MTSMDDTITNKLRDLCDDVERRDPPAFHMHLYELARRGQYDDVLDTLTRERRSTELDEDDWMRVAERLDVLWISHERALRSNCSWLSALLPPSPNPFLVLPGGGSNSSTRQPLKEGLRCAIC